jgi:hypothetical protein
VKLVTDLCTDRRADDETDRPAGQGTDRRAHTDANGFGLRSPVFRKR